MRKINTDRGFPGLNGPTPWTPQLAPREGCGPERPSPGAAGSARSSRRRSRGRPRPTGIGRKGWAAQILRGQHPSGQWVTPGSSAFDLYRPKYVATNWRLIVLSDLGLTKKTPRVAKAARLFLDRFARSGDLGGPASEVCITGNAVRMMARFGYLKDPRVKAGIEWLVRHQKKDGGWHCFRSRTGTLDCWEALAAFV